MKIKILVEAEVDSARASNSMRRDLERVTSFAVDGIAGAHVDRVQVVREGLDSPLEIQ